MGQYGAPAHRSRFDILGVGRASARADVDFGAAIASDPPADDRADPDQADPAAAGDLDEASRPPRCGPRIGDARRAAALDADLARPLRDHGIGLVAGARDRNAAVDPAAGLLSFR